MWRIGTQAGCPFPEEGGMTECLDPGHLQSREKLVHESHRFDPPLGRGHVRGFASTAGKVFATTTEDGPRRGNSHDFIGSQSSTPPNDRRCVVHLQSTWHCQSDGEGGEFCSHVGDNWKVRQWCGANAALGKLSL